MRKFLTGGSLLPVDNQPFIQLSALQIDLERDTLDG